MNKDTNQSNNKPEYKFQPFFKWNKSALGFFMILITFTVVLYWAITHTEKLMDVLRFGIKLLSPFLIGFCIAFVLNMILCPLEKLWEYLWRKKKGNWHVKLKRPVCLLLSVLLLLGAIFILSFIIIPEIRDTAVSFVDALPGYLDNLTSWADNLISRLEKFGLSFPAFSFDMNQIIEMANKLIHNYGESVIDKTVGITSSIVGAIFDLVMAFVFALYLLAQKERIGLYMRKLLYAFFCKEKTDKFIDLTIVAKDTFTKFLTGQLTEACIIGLLCFVGMLIFRMPYAPVVSVLVGVTALIPVFGAFIGTGIGAFLILLVDPMKAVWFVIFIIVLQQLEGNLIYPKVVGKSVGLPGILVLAAVTVGGGLLGIVGMLFSVPICSVLYCLCNELISKRLRERGIVDTDLKPRISP